MSWRQTLPVNQRVLVNLKTDRAVAGVLIRTPGNWLVLADAEIHEAGVKPRLMDGQVYIERPNVNFIQVAAPKGG